MKKFLAILVLGLLFSGNAYASIIEIGKCISGSLDQLKANYNLEWNEAAYKNHNTLYYKFLDTPKKSGENVECCRCCKFKKDLRLNSMILSFT